MRIRSGRFSIEESVRLSDVEKAMQEGCVEKLVLPVDQMFAAYPAVYCQRRIPPSHWRSGNAVILPMLTEQSEPVETLEGSRVHLCIVRPGVFLRCMRGKSPESGWNR